MQHSPTSKHRKTRCIAFRSFMLLWCSVSVLCHKHLAHKPPRRVSSSSAVPLPLLMAAMHECRFIMNLTEAKSIGKRPSPQFTNYSFFKSQAARVLPLERLPGQQVRQAGRQGGRVPIIGMVYPRQNTAHSAVARLGLTPLKWRGLLENAVSLSQVWLLFFCVN